MSDPTAQFFAFTEAQMVDVRRYCGYPAYGAGSSVFMFQRFTDAYNLMEDRLTSLSQTEGVVVSTYLTTLNGLEAAIPAAAANLDTDSAAVWFHNKREIQDRTAVFNDWCGRLAGYIGVPLGPFFGGARQSVGMRII
jgi:hypothetical protein